MKVLISGSEVPVWLAPEKQYTTSSWLPPLERPERDWIWVRDRFSVPLNELATGLVPAEWRKACPLGRIALKTAEPWNPALHPTVVAHVGEVPLIGPLAGLSETAPGSEPTPAAWAAA